MSAAQILTDDLDRMAVSPYHFEPVPMTSFYSWPSSAWSQLKRLGRELGVQPKSPIGKDGFQVGMDVANFLPSELSVKVVEGSIVVEGKHDEREDEHGYISRHFVRRYVMPKGYEAHAVVSTISTDGLLVVSIPKPQHEAENQHKQERAVPIHETGVPHLKTKERTYSSSGVELND